jgi:hypothetical protein
MTSKVIGLDLVIAALRKLDPATGERQNLLAFLQSCYGGRVRTYDLDRASESLAKLTDEERDAVIDHVI